MLSLILAGVVMLSGIATAGAMDLSDRQKSEILAEAEACFDRGSKTLPANPISARKDFAAAAEKYQLLINSSADTGLMFYNLANAQLQAGYTGKAIANYKRSAQLMGPDKQLEQNLRYARSLRDGQKLEQTSDVSSVLDSLGRNFPVTTQLWCGVGAWAIFWIAMIVRLIVKKTIAPKFRSRYILASSAIVFAVMAGSVGYEVLTSARQVQGVVTADSARVLKGNGEGFAPKFKEPITEGAEFNVLQQRGNWLKIKLSDGKTGWIKAQNADIIKPRTLWG